MQRSLADADPGGHHLYRGAGSAHLAGLVSAAAVVFVAVLGIVLSLVVSWGLSHSVLKGEASAFSLELPPYRPPRVLQTIYTSVIDRTLIVLWRAVVFAIPAGAVIWLLSHIHVGDLSLAEHFINNTNGFGLLIGLNGVILLAYIVAIPANEIIIPTILMLTVLSARLADGARGHVRTGFGSSYRRYLSGRGVDAADGGQPHAVQPGAQSLFDDDLHHLQGNQERQMDHIRVAATGRMGLCSVSSWRSLRG